MCVYILMNNIFDYDSLLTKTYYNNKRPIIKKIIREETDNIKYVCNVTYINNYLNNMIPNVQLEKY